jgi:hypothetical protein
MRVACASLVFGAMNYDASGTSLYRRVIKRVWVGSAEHTHGVGYRPISRYKIVLELTMPLHR